MYNQFDFFHSYIYCGKFVKIKHTLRASAIIQLCIVFHFTTSLPDYFKSKCLIRFEIRIFEIEVCFTQFDTCLIFVMFIYSMFSFLLLIAKY